MIWMKSQVDMNFNMKDMKMIMNISIKTLKSQNYGFRFSVPGLCIFNCLVSWKFHCYILKHSTEHCLQIFDIQLNGLSSNC